MGFKLVLSGVTGRIGAHVLDQALQNTSVSSIIALSRRPLPGLARHSKLEILVLDDFTQYTDAAIATLSGADGCIWCMTTTAGDPALELDYPRAFAAALAPTLQGHGRLFRYLHLTGAMVERDQTRSLWAKSGVRKIKGQGELQAIGFATDPVANRLWDTIIARPGMVVKRGTYIGEASMLLTGASGSCIRSDELALALLDAVLHGSDKLLLPQMLLRKGQELAALQREQNPDHNVNSPTSQPGTTTI